MIEPIEQSGPLSRSTFDAIIDVRSPSEFEEDHLPGAVNLPVLNDLQRAEVGTLYVQQSKFLARRVGAAIVSRNIADHLSGALSEKPGSFHPLIYCWRGGQRSLAMATVLSQVGWRVGLLSGGYKNYRSRVTAALYDARTPLALTVLTGHTGTGKTQVLNRLAARGLQTIDLEALAGHRGSLFGREGGARQPSQKMFESRLLSRLEALDPRRPAVIEAEASRIGALFVPPFVWTAMQDAPRLELQASPEARARFIAKAYGDLTLDLDQLLGGLDSLPRHHSREDKDHWKSLARSSETEALALGLITAHYDPAYRRSGAKASGPCVGRLALGDLSSADLDQAADAAASLILALA